MKISKIDLVSACSIARNQAIKDGEGRYFLSIIKEYDRILAFFMEYSDTGYFEVSPLAKTREENRKMAAVNRANQAI